MREITLTVRGDTVQASRRRAGVQGEANATDLVVSFDESWDGYAKTITFFDAYGQNPVKRVLTTDLLVDAANDIRTYKTKIPGEPLAFGGECELIIDGVVDGVRARSMTVRLSVDHAPMTDDAGESADPTPTQAEQLQVQIDAIITDIQKAAQAANAKEAAEASAAKAASYATHPPEIGENGNWFLWDGEKYVDTGVPVQEGAAGKDGGYYFPSVTQPNANTMRVSFVASKSDMPTVSPVTVTLPAGPAGAKGDKGDTGADGKTPVKGEDYYTPADKQEMVNDVLAALPNGDEEAY